MTRKYMFEVLILMAGLAVALMAAGGRAAAISKVQSPFRSPVSVQANLGSGFTYQGFVQDNGSPINGSCDFTFTLYDAATGGSQVGATETETNVAVSDGRFTVELNEAGQFGAGAFDGEARWLQVAVRCPSGTGSYTSLTPRQPLSASPYALSLQPGATISGTAGLGVLRLNNRSGNGLYVGAADDDGAQIVSAGADGVKVFYAGTPDASSISAWNNGFEVAGAEGTGLYVGHANQDGVHVNSAGWDGLAVVSADGNGLRVFSAGTDVGDDGLQIDYAGGNGVYVDFAEGDGVRVDGTYGSGVHVVNADSDGVHVNSAGNIGLRVDSASSHGVRIGAAGDSGLQVDSAGIDGVHIFSAVFDGVEVVSAGTDGLNVDSAGDDGLEIGQAGEDGVYVLEAGNPIATFPSLAANGFELGGAEGNGLHVGWAGQDGLFVLDAGNDGVDVAGNNLAGYFLGNVQVTGSCSGCALATFGINSSQQPMEPGAIVALQGSRPIQADSVPLLLEVAPARSGQPIVGVVQGRAELVAVAAPRPDEIGQRLIPREGAAAPGEHVTIIIYGLVQVQAAALDSPIAAGDRLAVNASGAARPLQTTEVNGIQLAEDAPTLGIALEELAAGGEGLIWLLVNPH